MVSGTRILVTTLVMLSLGAEAQTSCLPSGVAAQVFEIVDPKVPFEKTYVLNRWLAGEAYPSLVQMEWKSMVNPLDGMEGWIRFRPDFDGVSVPFNVYGVMIILNGQPLLWWDLTDECKSPGVGLFPGDLLKLPSIKWAHFQKQSLQIQIWAR